MALRRRNGRWHYRFKLDGREYSGTTDLADTARNETQAKQLETDHRQALLEGRTPLRRFVVREFTDAAEEFLEWAKMEYRAHPNSHRRIATSLTSAKKFFAHRPVSTIYESEIEAYKVWRVTEHKVRDITLRHDLHALSTFFQYAIKQHWTRENPIRNVKIPSDGDAVRIHVIMLEEEREYFKRASRNRNLYDLARLIRNQGMRPEEVMSLRKEDIDLERGQLRIRFGKIKAARRTLNLTAESRSILAKRCQGPSIWIFPSERKSGRHIVRMNGAHDTACAGNKTRRTLHFVLYDFRHTLATEMAQAGVDLATLAAILGHSSIRVVQKYVHPTADRGELEILLEPGVHLDVLLGLVATDRREKVMKEASLAVPFAANNRGVLMYFSSGCSFLPRVIAVRKASKTCSRCQKKEARWVRQITTSTWTVPCCGNP